MNAHTRIIEICILPTCVCRSKIPKHKIQFTKSIIVVDKKEEKAILTKAIDILNYKWHPPRQLLRICVNHI
jgi:hypothetical protein